MHGEDCAAILSITTHTASPRANALDDVKVHPASQPTALTRTDEPSIHDVIEPPARLTATTNLFSPTSPISRIGGARRDRTDDLMLAKHALSQLSYGPDHFPISVAMAVVGPDRFELSTPRLSSVCSNQLSYGPAPAGAAYVMHAGAATGLVLSNNAARIAAKRE